MDIYLALGTLVRHALTTGGGYLVASGIATQDQTGQIIGGLIALGGVLLSLYNKRRK